MKFLLAITSSSDYQFRCDVHVLSLYSSPPQPLGDMYQGPQGMSETMDTTELYIYSAFSYTYLW